MSLSDPMSSEVTPRLRLHIQWAVSGTRRDGSSRHSSWGQRTVSYDML
jgi:hypothetical protein